MIKFKKKSLRGSSKRWIQRKYNDNFIKKTKQLNYRSRAVFKLIEIDKKFNCFKKNHNILDLGSSPGSWSQYLIKKGFKNILSIDVLQMEDIPNVNFILGDFTDNKIQKKIFEKFHEINIIISDIAVNTTGNKKLDSYKTNSICLEVLKFSFKYLCQKGVVIAKYFNGELEKNIIQYSKVNFKRFKIIKPLSSRKDSKEIYIYCEK